MRRHVAKPVDRRIEASKVTSDGSLKGYSEQSGFLGQLA
jgi:hypothetical protein